MDVVRFIMPTCPRNLNFENQHLNTGYHLLPAMKNLNDVIKIIAVHIFLAADSSHPNRLTPSFMDEIMSVILRSSFTVDLILLLKQADDL
ncbi:hypothetical protein ACTXT7_003666 [Hymenolepis weldensis]